MTAAKNVLVLCSRNSARSQMAEVDAPWMALARRERGSTWENSR
jgi:protein-tyrosine-phosphatase